MYARRCGGCKRPVRIRKLPDIGWVLIPHADPPGRKSMCRWSGEVVGAPRKKAQLKAKRGQHFAKKRADKLVEEATAFLTRPWSKRTKAERRVWIDGTTRLFAALLELERKRGR